MPVWMLEAFFDSYPPLKLRNFKNSLFSSKFGTIDLSPYMDNKYHTPSNTINRFSKCNLGVHNIYAPISSLLISSVGFAVSILLCIEDLFNLFDLLPKC